MAPKPEVVGTQLQITVESEDETGLFSARRFKLLPVRVGSAERKLIEQRVASSDLDNIYSFEWSELNALQWEAALVRKQQDSAVFIETAL